MRLFACGIVLGLILGSAAVSSAAYISTDRWKQGTSQDLFHLGYVAGIMDAVETLKGASFFTRQTTAEALDAIARCTAPLTLGAVASRAENAVASGPAYGNAANVIMADLLKCQ